MEPRQQAQVSEAVLTVITAAVKAYLTAEANTGAPPSPAAWSVAGRLAAMQQRQGAPLRPARG